MQTTPKKIRAKLVEISAAGEDAFPFDAQNTFCISFNNDTPIFQIPPEDIGRNRFNHDFQHILGNIFTEHGHDKAVKLMPGYLDFCPAKDIAGKPAECFVCFADYSKEGSAEHTAEQVEKIRERQQELMTEYNVNSVRKAIFSNVMSYLCAQGHIDKMTACLSLTKELQIDIKEAGRVLNVGLEKFQDASHSRA